MQSFRRENHGSDRWEAKTFIDDLINGTKTRSQYQLADNPLRRRKRLSPHPAGR